MESAYVIMYITVILATLLQVAVHCEDTDQISDIKEMRAMLKKALEVNRKLDWQNKRLMRMWSGLEQLCSILNFSPDDGLDFGEDKTTLTFEQKVLKSSTESEPNSDKQSLALPEPKDDAKAPPEVGDLDQPLHIISVKSSGVGFVNITVTYTAPEDHSTDWFATLDFNGQLRSAGNKRYHLKSVYTVHEAYYEPEVLQAVSFRLHAGDRSVHLLFSLLDLDGSGEQTMPAYPGDIIFSKQQYTAAGDSDVEVIATLPVPVSSDIIPAGSFVFFSGLNTTVYPIETFKYSNYDRDVISVIGNSTNGKSSVQVTIQSNVGQHGGILTVRPPSLETIGGYVLQLNYERYVTIVSSNTGDVIQRNKIALFPLDKQTVIASSFYSLWCAATGNPTPEVKLLRQVRSGQTKEKKVQAVLTDKYTTIVSYTLSFNDKRKGLYICSATSGNHTIEDTTDVSFYRSVEIDQKSSKVAKKDTEEVRLVCKASGIPRPEVDIRISDPDGPDLSEWTKDFAASKTETVRSTTLVVSLVKPSSMPTIFCIGSQNGGATTKSFQIFPPTS